MSNCCKTDKSAVCCEPNNLDNFSGVVIDIALMAEDMPTVHKDCSTTQHLAPIDVTWNQFHNLFYFNNGGFTPNTSLSCVCPFDKIIQNEGKVLTDGNCRSKDYNLMTELLDHYTEHLEESPLCWDVCSRVEFEKKVSSIKSLFDVGVCNVKCSLSLDEFFDSLSAHGVEISEVTGMPTLAAQQKKVVALVTTKFVSQNTGGEDGVPDLNISWPFRIDFRACIAAPMGRGCCTTELVKRLSPDQIKCGKVVCVDPCEKNPDACNCNAYGVDDGACQKLNDDGSPMTLADLLDENDLFRCSGAEEDPLCVLIPKLAASPQRALYPCINNLDMSELCKKCCAGFNIKEICWPYLHSDETGDRCTGQQNPDSKLAFPCANVNPPLPDPSPEGFTTVDIRLAKAVVTGPNFHFTLPVFLTWMDGGVTGLCCVTPKDGDIKNRNAVWNVLLGDTSETELDGVMYGLYGISELDLEVIAEAKKEFCALIADGHQACEFDAYIEPWNLDAPLPGPDGSEDYQPDLQKRACAKVCEVFDNMRYWTFNGCEGWCCAQENENPCNPPIDCCDKDGSGANCPVIKARNVASPWGCTDWCPGDRYKTSYETATWKLHCDDGCNPNNPTGLDCELERNNRLECLEDLSGNPVPNTNPNAVGDCCNVVVAYRSNNDNAVLPLSADDCNDTELTPVLVPSEKNDLWRWHQVCCDDKEDCYNIIGCQQFCAPSKNCCVGPCGPKNGGRCGGC